MDGVDGVLVVRTTGTRAAETRVQIGDGGDSSALLHGDAGDLTRWFCGRSSPPPTDLSGDADIVDAVSDRLAMTP